MEKYHLLAKGDNFNLVKVFDVVGPTDDKPGSANFVIIGSTNEPITMKNKILRIRNSISHIMKLGEHHKPLEPKDLNFKSVECMTYMEEGVNSKGETIIVEQIKITKVI